MKKLLLLTLLAFAIIGGTVTVMTYHPQTAHADCSGQTC
jgi:hypothetical protein